MAIKRCPYCKAIIEEDSGFCSNCGTRLLFPEDEFEEEEIPGDKIDEEEAPSGQPEEVEPGEEPLEQGEEEKEEAEEEMEIEEKKKEKTAESEKIEKREVEGFLESIKREKAEKAKKEGPETLEEVAQEILEKMDRALESTLEKEREEGIKKEAQPESGQIKFKTEELEQIPDARTKDREEIESFLASLRAAAMKPPPRAEAPPTPQEKREEGLESPEEEVPPRTPEQIDTDEKLFIRKEIEEKLKAGFKAEGTEEAGDAEEKEKEEIDRFLETVKRDRAEKTEILEEEIPPPQKKISEESAEVGKELPPWAERVQKGTPLEVEVEGEREAAPELGKELQEVEEEEVEEEAIEEEIPAPESEVESRARMEQIGLPFEREIEEERALKRRAPSKLSIWLKSRAFDLLSIAVLWIISLWLASRVMGVSVFKLFSASAFHLLAFYLVLLVIYFSFFILLLGETLGDLIFSREE